MKEYDNDIVSAMIDAAWGSVCETAIAPMQDFLNLDGSARMNFPGTVGGNWLWRMQECDYEAIARRIRIMNRKHKRGNYQKLDAAAIIADAENIICGKFHTSIKNASAVQLHEGISAAVMNAIAPMWADDHAARIEKRHALYLSAEFLVGRLVYNNLYCMGVLDEVKAALDADR